MSSIIKKECEKIIEKIDFSQLNNKKVLVTGASGLVGIFMIATLKELRKKYNIEIFAWIKSEIDPAFADVFDGCNIIRRDITDSSSYSDLPPMDVIIHSAGYAQPTKFLQNKLKTIEINTVATQHLLMLSKPDGKFLFISSSEVYSGIDSEGITETDIGTTNTNHPRSCYIEGKRCGESICYTYREYDFNVKIARLSLAYGPGTKIDDQRVMSSIIRRGLEEDKISLMDSGDAIRTYCYITDAIEMFWNILLFGKETLYNVGGKSVTSILELAKMVGKELNKDVVTPEISNQLIGNPKIVNVSIDKYVSEFNKVDFVSLDDGIKRTIDWQKSFYE